MVIIIIIIIIITIIVVIIVILMCVMMMSCLTFVIYLCALKKYISTKNFCHLNPRKPLPKEEIEEPLEYDDDDEEEEYEDYEE